MSPSLVGSATTLRPIILTFLGATLAGVTYLESVILGLVQGLTEFLPVSSTGHLILSGHFLGIQDRADVKAFEVIIQIGTVLAVLWHYRRPLGTCLLRALRGDYGALRIFTALGIAFLPAAAMGLLFAKLIKTYLFGPGPVVAALACGGLFMILIERGLKRRAPSQVSSDTSADAFGDVERMSLKKAFGVGCFQCLALWPGMSRSMSSILGGRILGLGPAQATEFSFLLSIPTLLAAGGYDLLKPEAREAIAQGGLVWLAGLAVAFITALIVIRVFLRFVRRYPLEVFGWYRLLAALALGLIL